MIWYSCPVCGYPMKAVTNGWVCNNCHHTAPYPKTETTNNTKINQKTVDDAK